MFDKTKEVCQSTKQEHAASLTHPLRGFARPKASVNVLLNRYYARLKP